MKKLLIALTIALVFLTPLSLLAQSNALKINFLSPIFKTVTVSYEHCIRSDKSFQITGYLNFGEPFESYSQSDVSGYGFALDYRAYLSGSYMDGFYVGPFLRFKQVSAKYEYYDYSSPVYGAYRTEETTASILGIGILFGRQFVIKDALTIDLFAGPGYEAYIDKSFGNYYLVSPLAYSVELIGGYHVRGGVTVGFTF